MFLIAASQEVSNLIKIKGRYNYVICTTVPIQVSYIISNGLGNSLFNHTLASQFAYTVNTSFVMVTSSVIIGCLIHKYEYSRTLLPSGVPIFISPLLISIETLSQTSRIISLAVRITANIVSGHTLTHMISNFAGLLITFKPSLQLTYHYTLNFTLIISFILYLLLSTLCFVELAISLLQAYVFGLLSVSYIQDSIRLH